jgi:protein-tyrosine phosphatase
MPRLERPAVLFVCLGNICRSPLAEGAFRHAAWTAGLDVEIDSAGTAHWHVGKPPDPRAIAAARGHGVDISNLRARQIGRADFGRFAHIFALDASNLADLRRIDPGDGLAHISLLLDLVAERTGEDVVDPYYGGPEDFERTWRDVTSAAKALATRLKRR